MATWRRKALELFPDLRRDLNDRTYTIYMLFFDLLPMVREAHREENGERLRKIYGFASWCVSHRSEHLWNPAAVAFYEHLFDCREDWDAVIPWLSPFVIEACRGLWEARLDQNAFAELQVLLEKRVAAKG